MNTNAIVNVRTFTSCLLPTRSFIRITSPFSSIIPDCFAAPSKVKNHFDIDGKRRFLELQQYSVLVLRQQKRAVYKTSGYVVNSYGSR